MRWLPVVLCIAIGAVAACDTTDGKGAPPPTNSVVSVGCAQLPTDSGEARDLAIAKCIVRHDTLHGWTSEAPRSVVLFLDHSGSMAGFLDPNYSTQRTDFRSVLDGILAGLHPSHVYLYGTTLQPAEVSLGALGQASLYDDNNTNLELALDSVAHDGKLTSDFIIVGDGRRGDPDVANGQYTHIRDRATQWINAGGVFAVAVSRAPFHVVPDDPSGCRTSKEAKLKTCPLYAFAFIAPGDVGRVASILAGVFEHLCVWPVPAIAPGEWTLNATSSADFMVERGWLPGTGMPTERVARVRTQGSPNKTLVAALLLADSTSAGGRAQAAVLRSLHLVASIRVKGLDSGAATRPWTPVQGAAQVRSKDSLISKNSLAFEFVSRSADGARSIYRVDLLPDATPAWAGEFAAVNRDDAQNTFGLDVLFRGLAQVGLTSAGRFYIVTN
jgi:hypothetical protein